MIVNFSSQFLKECVCKFMNKSDIQDDDVSKIRYLHIMGITGGYIALSSAVAPNYIYFPEMGNADTNLYDLWDVTLDLQKVLDIKKMTNDGFYLKKVRGVSKRLEKSDMEMEEFRKNIVGYNPDIPLMPSEKKNSMSDEEMNYYYKKIFEYLFVDLNDLEFFNGLEVLRITDLEGTEIDSLEFLSYMPKLKIFELGGEYIIKCNKGMEELKKLNQLCIWES